MDPGVADRRRDAGHDDDEEEHTHRQESGQDLVPPDPRLVARRLRGRSPRRLLVRRSPLGLLSVLLRLLRRELCRVLAALPGLLWRILVAQVITPLS